MRGHTHPICSILVQTLGDYRLLYVVLTVSVCGDARVYVFVTRSLGKYVTTKSLRPFPFTNGQAKGNISPWS